VSGAGPARSWGILDSVIGGAGVEAGGAGPGEVLPLRGIQGAAGGGQVRPL